MCRLPKKKNNFSCILNRISYNSNWLEGASDLFVVCSICCVPCLPIA